MTSGYIKIVTNNAHSTYEDGDIISACNHLTIRRSASQRICFAKIGTRQFAGLNGSGFVPHSHVLKDWHEACCEFRLERLSQNTCKQIRLSDMVEIEIVTGVPFTDLRGNPNRQMDVELYFKRQMKTFSEKNVRGKAIFSDDGVAAKVVIYGGHTNLSGAAQDVVWAAITTKTGKLEADETTYKTEPPFGSYKRRQVIIRVDDFTDVELASLVESLIDATDPENPITIKKRKNWVDWKTDLNLSAKEIDDVKDDSKNPDLRTEEKARAAIIKIKTI